MGLGSSLKKAVKKITKGLKKLVNLPIAIARESWKGVKKAWKSKLGRIVLIAAAIWVGGGLLAMQFTGASGLAAFSPANVMAGYKAAGSALYNTLSGAATGGETAAAAEGGVVSTGAGGVPAQTQLTLGSVEGGATAGNAGAGITVPQGAISEGVGGVQGLSAETTSALSGAGKQTASSTLLPAEGGFNLSVPTTVPPKPPPGFLTQSGKFMMSTGGGMLTAAGLTVGGQALAAANEPSAAEIEAERLRAMQQANSLTGVALPTPTQAQARFIPGFNPRPAGG